jgi:hypothetical protein
MAARATFALKAGEWFRRGRLLMVSPVHGDYRRCQAEIPLIVLSKFPRPALGVQETLAYYAFPDIHWQKIRTNNPLERFGLSPANSSKTG